MSTPSLLNVPYRLKAGTLYSQIPETGLGDFAVTRATSPTNNLSTRVNSLGFIERVNDGVPRLDYPLGGAVNGCPALLVEPSAQNLALQSEDFMTTWSLANVTRTANQATSPDNTLTADRISITSNGGYIRQLLATSNSLTYTASCFVKNDAVASGDTFRFYFNNNLGGGNSAVANATININAGTVSTVSSGAGVSSVSTGIENYGNGWYRVRVTFTLGASAGNASSEIGFEAPTATRTFFAWGAQLEVGSVPTSYIPTTTLAITRAADVIDKTGIASLIGQTEGTIYVEAFIPKIPSAFVVGISNGLQVTEAVYLQVQTNLALSVLIRSGGTIAGPSIASANWSAGLNKVAFTYGAGSCSLVLNGGSPVPATVTNVPTCNRITLGSRVDVPGTLSLTDRIRAAAIYPNRLSNAELIALTTP
jgi:hypothetical protein